MNKLHSVNTVSTQYSNKAVRDVKMRCGGSDVIGLIISVIL